MLSVREALINAIYHRDYSAYSGSITLAIFDDRLEIWNNGKLPKPLKLEDLLGEHGSWPRNKLIANVFYSMGLVETWGTGTNRMIALCEQEGLPKPEFKEYSGGFAVIFKFKNPIGFTQALAKIQSKVDVRHEAILNLLKESKPLSSSEIHQQLKQLASLRSIKADLSALQKLGKLQRQGKGKNTLWQLT